jgi:hypothetical protein
MNAMKAQKGAERSGAILILVVMLLFVLIAIAGLLIDVGMARLTQAHMQSVTDASAIEGGWFKAMGTDEIAMREAVVRRADEISESWGQRRIELDGGYDLDDDVKAESAQTFNRDTLGDPVKQSLDLNMDNEFEGDIVTGLYDESEVPSSLPGQPVGHDLSPAFEPNAESYNSILVRLRRTGERDIPGGVSAERLTFLWSRGSLLNFGLRGRGIAVRSESIAKMAPVVAVGDSADGRLPTALNVAIPLSEVTAETFSRESLMISENPRQIGALVTSGSTANFTGVGYLPIAKQMSAGQWEVIGYLFAEVTECAVIPLTLNEVGFETANATASLAQVENLTDELVHSNQSLSGDFIAFAPVLVRSQQLQGDSP